MACSGPPVRGVDIAAEVTATNTSVLRAAQRHRLAQEGYQAVVRAADVGMANMADSCTWSLRLMQAEIDLSGENTPGKVAAATAHFERMKKVEDLTRRRQQAGLANPLEVFTAEYYRLEAEEILARLERK